MKQLVLSISVIGCSVLLFACASDGNTTPNASRVVNSAANTVNAAVNSAGKVTNTVANAINSVATESPSKFMEEAAQGGLAEVEMGKLAGQKGQDAEVKKFGQMMVTDHTKAGAELKTLAGGKKMTLPPDMGPHQKMFEKLKGMSGADFDKAYVDGMVEDHETDVAAFQKQADNGTDPEVKAFAAKTLPVLKKHLDAIKAIQAKMK